jgi:hypothetical protein
VAWAWQWNRGLVSRRGILSRDPGESTDCKLREDDGEPQCCVKKKLFKEDTTGVDCFRTLGFAHDRNREPEEETGVPPCDLFWLTFDDKDVLYYKKTSVL